MIIVRLNRNMLETRIIRTLTWLKRQSHSGPFYFPHGVLVKSPDIIQTLQDTRIRRIRNPCIEIDLLFLLRI